MINIALLTEKDIGRHVIYEREYCKKEVGVLTSWNERFIFVRFRGPTGESCQPEDVRFENGN